MGSRMQFTAVALLVIGLSPGGLLHAQTGRPDRTLNAWIARADAQVESGRRARAIPLLRRAIRRAPEDPRAPMRLFRLWAPSGAAEAASPDEGVRARVREVTAALAAVRPSAEPEPSDAAAERITDQDVRLAWAWSIAVAGDHREAIERVSLAAPRLDARSVQALRSLAALAVRRHDVAAADDALRAARRIDPVTIELLTEHAAVRLARGRADDAVALLMEARERRPDVDAVRRDLAGALLAAGRAPEATQLLAGWAAEHPDDASAVLSLARAALEAGQTGRAVNAARRVMALSPRDPVPALVLAEASLAAGRTADAATAYREALRRDPTNTRAREGLRALAGATRTGPID